MSVSNINNKAAASTSDQDKGGGGGGEEDKELQSSKLQLNSPKASKLLTQQQVG